MKERTLFANSAWGMISQVSRASVGLVFVSIVISKIGLEGYGWYAILMLLSFYQGLLGQIDLGYPSYLTILLSREDPKLTHETAHRLRGLLSYLLAGSGFFMGVTILFPTVLLDVFKIDTPRAQEFSQALGLIFLANFCSIYVATMSIVWIARHATADLKKFETGSYLIFIVAASIGLQFHPSIRTIAASFLLSQAVFAFALYLQSRSTFQITIVPGRIPLKEWKEDWPSWKPFLFFRLNGMAQRQSDATLISVLLGPEFVGAYDISMKIPALIKGLLGRVSEVLGPFASRRNSPKDLPLMRSLCEKLVSLEICLGIVVAISTYFFGTDLAQIWLGHDHQHLGETMFLATLLNIALPPASVLLAVLVAQGKRASELTWWPTWISIASIIATIPVTLGFGLKGTIVLTVLQFAMLSATAIVWARADFHYRISSGFKLGAMTFVLTAGVCGITRILIPHPSETWAFLGVLIAGEGILVLVLFAVFRQDLHILRSLMSQKASVRLDG